MSMQKKYNQIKYNKQELLALDCLAESIRISIGTFDLLLNSNNEEKETFIRGNQNDTSRSLQTSNWKTN